MMSGDTYGVGWNVNEHLSKKKYEVDPRRQKRCMFPDGADFLVILALK